MQKRNVFHHVFSRDMTEEGWILVKGFNELDPVKFPADDLELVPILREDEFSISGPEIRKRALRENANLGQRFAEWLLAYPGRIPSRPKDCQHILFPRTVWSDCDGRLLVPILGWFGLKWGLYFVFLRRDWYSLTWFVRARASSTLGP